MASDLDRIREFQAAWDAADFSELRDLLEGKRDLQTVEGELGEFGRLHAELIDPEITFEVSAVEAYAVIWPRGSGAGVGEWLSMWANWFTSWESITLLGSNFSQVGDTVIQRFRAHLVGRGSGVELDIDHIHSWVMRDGRVVSFVIHPSLEDAVEAAGR